MCAVGNNVHGTGSGYNECRNLEWQVCAAKGMLPGQQSPNIIFARAPKTVSTSGDPKFDNPRCIGWAPKGCDRGFSSNDIFFLEICMFSMMCKNRESLFQVDAGRLWQCDFDEGGFREMQSLLVNNPRMRGRGQGQGRG